MEKQKHKYNILTHYLIMHNSCTAFFLLNTHKTDNVVNCKCTAARLAGVIEKYSIYFVGASIGRN